MPRAPRSLQACQECRKHKTRCNGLRPQCDVCTRKRRSCHWSDGLAPGGYKHLFFEGSTSTLNGDPDKPPRVISIRQPAEMQLQADSACDLPSLPLRRRLIDIFAQTHHLLDLCGCIHLDALQDEGVTSENRFLLESILALSALYLPLNEAQSDSRFTSAKGMVRYYRNKAQASSRQSSDQPTIINIQANLVLGLCELLTMATSKSWLHIGLAVRMAQTLRMRNEYSGRHIPRKREIRRRTFWACVIFDRLVAYCTFRTQTIDLALVGLHLPCSDIAFAFGHDSPGPKMHELGTQPHQDDGKSTLSYFVKTFILWSPISQAYVDGGRRVSPSSLYDPSSRHWQNLAVITNWLERLPDDLQWSENNLRAHQSLGQLSHFTSVHLLIQHALFLAHHEHLPQLEDLPLPSDFASAALRSDVTNPDTITTCMTGANCVINMLQLINAVVPEFRNTPPGICSIIPVVTTASVLLWFQYVSPLVDSLVQSSQSDVHRARSDVDYLLSLLDGWSKTWVLAKAFASSIRLLDDFYQSKYGRVIRHPTAVNINTTHSQSLKEQGNGTESVAASPTPLCDGDGFPEITGIPQGTYYKVRLITGLVLEQPELCKKFLHIFGEQGTEATEQQLYSWENDLDFSWINDMDLLADSPLWPDSALQLEQ